MKSAYRLAYENGEQPAPLTKSTHAGEETDGCGEEYGGYQLSQN